MSLTFMKSLDHALNVKACVYISWELVPLKLLELLSSPPVWEVCAQEKFGRYVPKIDIMV